MARPKSLVIGLGLSGRSAAGALLERGYEVFGVDDKLDALLAQGVLEPLLAKGLSLKEAPKDLSLVVLSPGVPPTHPRAVQARTCGCEVIGEVELAMRWLESATCVAITGTNGKTTVTSLIAHVLETAGMKAKSVGNIGVPLTSLEISEDTVYVIELSSYQLETLSHRAFVCGVLLNITPDHLDRYPSMEAYAKAKCRLQDCIKAGGDFFVQDKTAGTWGHLLGSSPIKTFGFEQGSIVRCDETYILINESIESIVPLSYRGKRSHDVENMLAANAVSRALGILPDTFEKALDTFQKPPHRVEWVANIDGVHFYDDSKGTNIDAVVRAVESLESSILLIAGGVHKGASYRPWIEHFGDRVKRVFAIGQAAPLIANDLMPSIPVTLCATLQNAVEMAASAAKSGETVLLSPGCSSYDMFKDYAHRGEEFKRHVLSLKREEEKA